MFSLSLSYDVLPVHVLIYVFLFTHVVVLLIDNNICVLWCKTVCAEKHKTIVGVNSFKTKFVYMLLVHSCKLAFHVMYTCVSMVYALFVIFLIATTE